MFGAANLSLVLYGILVLLRPGILLETFSLNVYQFPVDATRATAYLAGLFRLLGFFNIIPGLLGLLLMYRLRTLWQAWILRTAILLTFFAYLGPIVFDNTVGNVGFFEIVELVIFALVIMFGIVIWNKENDN